MRSNRPKATRELVRFIIRREFPTEDANGVLKILDRYCGHERDRVHLAVLKLSQGIKAELLQWIDTANRDYRDVLSPAEYPHYLEHSFEALRKNPALRKKIEEEDQRQYIAWLERREGPNA